MMRALHKRLQRLESSRPHQKTLEMDERMGFLKNLLWWAIGHYLGDPRPGEVPGAAVARGLGYAHEGELLEALSSSASGGGNADDFNERWSRATDRLLINFGFDANQITNEAYREELQQVLIRMEAGVATGRFRLFLHRE